MRIVLLFVSFVSLASCVHVRRGPASFEGTEVSNSCRAGFQELYSTTIEKFADLNAWRSALVYMRDTFPEEVDRAIRVPASVGCERHFGLVDAENAVIGKQSALRALVRDLAKENTQVEKLRANPVFATSAFGEGAACLQTCMHDNEEMAYLQRQNKCRAICSVDVEFIRDFDRSPVKLTASTCSGTMHGQIKFHADSFREEFEKYRERVMEELNQRTAAIQELKLQISGVEQILREQARNAREAKPRDYRCKDENLLKLAYVRESLSDKGFYAGNALVSQQAALLNDSGEGGSGAPKALRLPASATIPARDQIFYLSELTRESRNTLVRCRFMGFDYVKQPRADGWSYALSCPGLKIPLGDRIGGPVIDVDGRAWAVAFEHRMAFGRVYATPLSVNERGDTLIGLRQSFQSELCLNEDFSFTKRCQVGSP